jgi:hypothetical protein
MKSTPRVVRGRSEREGVVIVGSIAAHGV